MSFSLDAPLTVKYNGTDINSIAGVAVTGRKVNDLPAKGARIYKLARQDGSILTTAELGEKKILITGIVTADSRANAEIAIDAIRALIATPEGELEIPVAGNPRRYTATMTAMNNTVRGGLVEFTIEFTCSYPLGTDPTQVTLLNAVANTASNFSRSIAIDGSYKAEPFISILFSAISGGTASTVSVYNSADGIGLDITRDWVAGDLLEIDNLNKTCQVNSIEVARVGRFFGFQPGARSITYNDTFSTSRTLALTATYYRRYV